MYRSSWSLVKPWQYTAAIESKVSRLNDFFEVGVLSDTQLALGIGKIQNFAREGLEANNSLWMRLRGDCYGSE